MKVARIKTQSGIHIEPALDRAWDAATQLDWHASVAGLDGGPVINVAPSRYKINGVLQPDYFGIQFNRSSSGPYSLEAAWQYINGIKAGWEARS